MRYLISLMVAAFCALPAHATFTLVQVKSLLTICSPACGGVTVTSTGAGHTLVVGVVMGSQQTIVSATGGTFTLCGVGCQNGDATSSWTDMAYTLNATGGTTSVVVTLNNNASGVVVTVWELSSTATITKDSGASVLQTTNCTSCTGVAPSISGTNDVVLTIAACGGTCSAITTYAADPATPWTAGDGAAHLINTTSGTAPSWTQSPTSHMAIAAMAFLDAGGASPTRGKLVSF